MPPPRAARVLADEELFDAPLASEANADVGTLSDEELFDAPLASEQNTSAEPMGPPEPPEPPRAWYEELADDAADPETYMAIAQGVTQNYGDEIAEQFDPEYGRQLRAAADKHPIAHGIGQAVPGIAGGVAAAPRLAMLGPQLARMGQAGIQAGLGALSEYGDSHDTGRAAYSGLASGAAGWFGSLVGEMGAGAVGAASAGARKLLGRAPPAAMSMDDQLAAVQKLPPPPPRDPIPMRPPPPRALPQPEPPPLKVAPPYNPHEGMAPYPLSPSAAPPPRAPYPPAPSMAPPPGPASEMDDVALDAFLAEFPPSNRGAVPIGGELGMPPYRPPGLGEGRTLGRANNGRFQPPVQPDDAPLDIPEALPPGRARTGLEAPEAPYESPEQMLLRADGPRGQPGPMPTPSMSEPPVPMGEPPPMPAPRGRAPNFIGELDRSPSMRPGPDPTAPRPYGMRDVEPIGPPRAPNDFGPPLPKDIPPPAPAPAGPPAQDPGMLWKGARALTHLVPGKGGVIRAGMDAMRPTIDAQSPAVTAAGRVAGELGWEMGAPAALGRKVNAQDAERPAYADAATTNYALSAVLSSGTSGLSPEDEAVITRAMVGGNDQALRAADFRLRLQNPAYARAVERELRSYQEGDY